MIVEVKQFISVSLILSAGRDSIANRNVANYGLVSNLFGNDMFRPILK